MQYPDEPEIKLWDLQSNTVIKTIEEIPGNGLSTTISNDNNAIYHSYNTHR